MMKASDLVSGDSIDLEDDKYADPDGDNPYYESNYVIVDAIELETPGCVRVDFEGSSSVGFPPEHELKVLERIFHSDDSKPLDEG
jgi:hypothetical protein